MSSSSDIADRINRIESWIEARSRPLVLCPIRFGVMCLLFLALMLSNLVAVAKWPFSAVLRAASNRRPDLPGEPIPADDKRLRELFEQDLPVIVDFWAEWCGPCLLMNGVLKDFAKVEASRVFVAKVDATLHPKLTSQHKVGGLPTLLLFRRGQEVGRHVGLMSLGQLQRFVNGAASASSKAFA